MLGDPVEQYPSIPRDIQNIPVYAFDKIDGSCIRVEWSSKTGFSKFGSRTRLLDPGEKPLGEAVELFNEKYAADLEQIFRKSRFVKATAFLEFYGPSSFAGLHQEEPHDLMLFDVHVYKQGMLTPKDFLALVGNRVETAPLLYHGNANSDFVESVRERQLDGMTFEGVVCKSNTFARNNRFPTFKVKSWDWLNTVKLRYSDNPGLLQQLL